MKRIIAFLLVVMIGVTSVGCSNSKSEKSVSIETIQKNMLEAGTKFPEMTQVNSVSEDGKDLFSYISDMDYSKVKNYCLAYAGNGLADEIAVIETKSSSDVEEAKKSLEAHKENRVKLYKTYQPDQVERAESGTVFVKGNYAVLIIGEQQKDIKAAFERSLSE